MRLCVCVQRMASLLSVVIGQTLAIEYTGVRLGCVGGALGRALSAREELD